MWKISHLKQKLLLTAAYLLIVAIFYHLGISCVCLRLTGFPCPGCGMTRAVLAALRLDFSAAFAAHPMFWSMPIVYAYLLLDHGLFPGKKMNSILLYGIGIGFLAQWLGKIVNC